MANEMRDRLRGLLLKCGVNINTTSIADRIIADGWIRPPCKVGNVVWIIEENAVERATVNKVEITGTSEIRITLKKLNLVGKYVYFQLKPKELGITIFIGENAKDQAEQKLKEMRGING